MYGVFGQVFVCAAGMLAVPIRLQYRVININNTKCTLSIVVFNHKSMVIIPARPCILLTRLYRWQYPGPQVN